MSRSPSRLLLALSLLSAPALAQVGVSPVRRIPVEGTPIVLETWEATDLDGSGQDFYRVSLDGETFSRARRTSYEIKLVHGDFDPAQEAVAPQRLADAGGELRIVQFVTPPLDAFRGAIEAAGGEVHRYLARHAFVVRMNEETEATVAELPYVRWIGAYHPAYRFDPDLSPSLGGGTLPTQRYRIQVLERGIEQKQLVAQRIENLGGSVVQLYPDGFLFDAILSEAQLEQVLRWNEVFFVDLWQAPEDDMALVRQKGGADQIELDYGFTGQGVRGECMDGNVNTSHPDLQSNPVILHGNNVGSASHGTPVTGVVFGDGATEANARGLLPDGQPIFGDYGQVFNRYAHTAQLLQAPYFASFQTNSWGSGLTTNYTNTTTELDDILFINDLLVTQSQSNTGSQDSRPQAWAKNIVSVGAVRHLNDLNSDNDFWGGSASIGPAADGRIKPDLHFWYDSIFTVSENGHGNFCCTSAATPVVAGHFGLLMQMWHENLFGTSPGGATVFDSRPKATTARALMINTAWQYDFSGTDDDLTRTHQGWGRPALKRLNSLRDKLFVVDETDVLQPFESAQYNVIVAPDEPTLRVTMVYLDRAGTTSSSQHRINDLSLRVTSPDGTQYWGNNGLDIGRWSTPGGASNDIDVVENVKLQDPQPGTWLVEVFADEIILDTHTETSQVDADFALVVSGVVGSCEAPDPYCISTPNSTGSTALISASGSTSIANNDLVLTTLGLPPQQFGLYFYGASQNGIFFGDGVLCVGSPNYRLPVTPIGSFGEAIHELDVTDPPNAPAQILGGSTWNFQFWYRDPGGPGGTGFNLSDGLSVVFCE